MLSGVTVQLRAMPPDDDEVDELAPPDEVDVDVEEDEEVVEDEVL
ncbi:MAG: hypothetical protein RL497_656 [Pseudomonadota bacterium]|jgi:hypothetical protein